MDDDGNEITEDEYLEGVLKPRKQDDSDRSTTREHIRKVFPNRNFCFMVRPSDRDSDLKRLHEIEDKSLLREEFVTCIEKVQRRIEETLKPKTMNGKEISGSGFAAILERYVEAFNDGGAVPNIQNAWEAVCESKNIEAG
jgi:hypothetical protein